MDELEAIEAELKECLQELDSGNGGLRASEDNLTTSDWNEAVNEMKTESKGREDSISIRESGNNPQAPYEPEGHGSEKVLQWKAAFQKRVEGKDGEEAKAKTVWLETAKRDLEEFYKRQENSTRTRSAKLKEEAGHVEGNFRDGGGLGDCSSSGSNIGRVNMWKRVADLCDFTSKARSAKDVSRMRSVIVALSQTQSPDAAGTSTTDQAE